MGLLSGTMTHTLFFVVIVAVLAVSVKSVDYRCRYMETKIANCTRTVYYPCPETEDSDESDSDSESQEGGDAVAEFISSIMRQWYGGSDVNWCEREQTFTCVMYRCYIGCCKGWKYDPETGTCSIPENPTPELECQNGGEVVQGDDGQARCQCPPRYTGARCEAELCDLNCMNDGMCDIVDGQPRCVCSEDFKGPLCATPICKGGCGMHGRCVAEDGQAKCKCDHRYRGPNCEIPIPEPEKQGRCPNISSDTYGACVEACHTDSNCPGKQKCCHNGCGRSCTLPANFACRHEGVDYKLGKTFKPDPCHVCVCLSPDPSKPFGGALCRNQTCPPIKSSCKKVVKPPQSCCGSCEDVAPEEDYEQPRFINCPVTIVTVDVGRDQNVAKLPFVLEARDHKGNKLDVNPYRTVFRAGIADKNFDTVIATSFRDYADNFARCQFYVRIRDVHAPNFTFCPSDVYMIEEGEARWELPRAVDNVGLVKPPTSRYQPGHYFNKGVHPVVYSSEDFEGNIARCHFFVKVGTTDALHHEHRGSHHDKNRHLMFIGGGVAAFLFIVVIIIVAVMCRRRNRGRRDQSAPPPPAYENGIYNVGTVMPPPPYKEKPPVYVSETDIVSEKKTEGTEGDKAPLDVGDVDVKLGVDNPTYRL